MLFVQSHVWSLFLKKCLKWYIFSIENVLKKNKITVIIAKSNQPQMVTYSFYVTRKLFFPQQGLVFSHHVILIYEGHWDLNQSTFKNTAPVVLMVWAFKYSIQNLWSLDQSSARALWGHTFFSDRAHMTHLQATHLKHPLWSELREHQAWGTRMLL